MNLQYTPTVVLAYPPLLRIWSALTAGVAFLTVLVGTLVTTFHVGMTDSLWPTAPWHLLLIERVPNFGFYVEHSHRLVGYLIGICVLVQTVGLWWSSPNRVRRWCGMGAIVSIAVGTGYGMRLVKAAGVRSVDSLTNVGFAIAAIGAVAFLVIAYLEFTARTAGRWQRGLVTLALLGVIAQGLLGGLRVYLNELLGPGLAVVHGMLAQGFLALVAVLALMTTDAWNQRTDLLASKTMRRLTLLAVPLVFAQIFFGGLLRHLDWPLAARLHPMLAFAVGLVIVLLAVHAFGNDAESRAVRRIVATLCVLLGLQVLLGIEAFVRAANPELRYLPVTIGDAAVRSTHVLIGFVMFALVAVLAARTWKARLIEFAGVA